MLIRVSYTSIASVEDRQTHLFLVCLPKPLAFPVFTINSLSLLSRSPVVPRVFFIRVQEGGVPSNITRFNNFRKRTFFTLCLVPASNTRWFKEALKTVGLHLEARSLPARGISVHQRVLLTPSTGTMYECHAFIWSILTYRQHIAKFLISL